MKNEEIKASNIDRVLREAIDCFIEFGIENTTLSLVAQRAGVSYRSIQRYFESKEDFVLKVLVLFFNESIELLISMFLKGKNGVSLGIEQIECFIDLQYEFSKKNTKYLILFSEMELYFCRNNVEDKIMFEHILEIDRIRIIWNNALIKGQEDGTVRKDIDIKLLSNVIYLFLGAVMQHLAVNYKDCDATQKDFFELELDICKQMILNYIKSK